VPSPHLEWDETAHLFGDWHGVARGMAEHGIAPWARYSAGVWSNVRGGFEKGARYAGFAQWGVDTDLDTLLGWKGGQFHVSWQSYHGGQPSRALIGQFAADAVSNFEAADSVRFYHIYLEQALFDGSLEFKIGQLAADDDFFVSHYGALFLNATFGDFISNTNEHAPPVYPLAAPGVYVLAVPATSWFARFGVYTADAGSDKGSNYGFDWRLAGAHGAAWAAEAGSERAPYGLPGTYTLGTVAVSADVTDWKDGGEASGAYLLYGMLDQALLLDANGDRKLGAFVRGLFAPQEDRDTIRWHVDGGWNLYSPLRGRDNDRMGMAFSYTSFGDDYLHSQRVSGERVTSHEALVEWTYQAIVTPWLYVQPDVQLFVDPHLSRSDALAIGARLVFEP